MAFNCTKGVFAGADIDAGVMVTIAGDGLAYPSDKISRGQYWPLGRLGPYHYDFQCFTRQVETSENEESKDATLSVNWICTPVGPLKKVPAPYLTRLFYYLIYKWYIRLHTRNLKKENGNAEQR